MYRQILLLLIIALLAGTSQGKVYINEIMYNPDGNEYDFEYVELYGEGDNISNWYFEGIDFRFPDDTLIDGYLIISNTLNDSGDNNDFLDRYHDINCSFEYKGTLLNTGETILLRDSQDKIMDVVTYYDWVEENCSIERKDWTSYSSDPDTWQQSKNGGTPGMINSVFILDDCDWEVSIVKNESVFSVLSFKVRVNKNKGEGKANLTIHKWIVDSYDNIIRNYSPTIAENILNQMTSPSYTPQLPKGEAYFIHANISDISCPDSDPSNDQTSELIYMIDEKQGIDTNSSILIKNTQSTVFFGDILSLSLEIYRGDTSKYAVYAYIAAEDGTKISEKNTIHVKSKFTNYSFTVPIQIKPNCGGKYPIGDYRIIVEGLDISAESTVELLGSDKNCEFIETKEEETKKKENLEYSITEMPLTVYVNESFDITLKIENNFEDDIEVEIYSYIYRGSKRYSEESRKYATIEEDDSVKLSLQNIIPEAEDGDYKIKVKIAKRGRKTTYDITKTISVKKIIKSVETVAQPVYLEIPEENMTQPELISRSEIIYESDEFKLKHIVPISMICFLILAVIFSIVGLRPKK